MNNFLKMFGHLLPEKSDSLEDLNRKEKAVEGMLKGLQDCLGGSNCSDANRMIDWFRGAASSIEKDKILKETGCDPSTKGRFNKI